MQSDAFVGASLSLKSVEPLFAHAYGSTFVGDGIGQTGRFTRYDDVPTKPEFKQQRRQSWAVSHNESELTALIRAHVLLAEVESIFHTSTLSNSIVTMVNDMEQTLNETLSNSEREATVKRRLGELEWKLDTVSTLSWSKGASLPRDVAASSVELLRLLDGVLETLPLLCEAASQIKQMDMRWRQTASQLDNCASVYVELLAVKNEMDRIERSVSEAETLLSSFSQAIEQFQL